MKGNNYDIPDNNQNRAFERFINILAVTVTVILITIVITWAVITILQK